ncbi:aromatic-ring-hydroxylating dioxygenase subunit beta [Pusillimonas sp. MFBS29]|uniref:aromatic-ring-hydroxylating dioxygenase subunit beta n=1 Tax=Pusillimonas sp. MFBS29 TaxID=2886690 RepID=UPI001D127F8E|nr:aromatic-ring-hydroxylating dioxygenase subunit beta [Pusillimonas sp. MFBS29]MCC2596989.1 aromatic-ring-hydroxylating dioxygenase subunit beta [Pusillimonas sp. MFBS29]
MNAQIEINPTERGLDVCDEIELYHSVAKFLYLEARLQDTHDYDGWEALWEEDAIYWIPANGSDTDPEQQMSIIYDNRSRIGVRVAQLKTGRRHTQTPRSELARIISNIEVVHVEGNEVEVRANAQIHEENLRGTTLWAARNEYLLRNVEGAFRLVRKKVVLVNNEKPVFTLSFLV